MKYWVVRYDVTSFGVGKEYTDLDVVAPAIVGEDYDDPQLAQNKCDELSASACGEEVEVDMKNGKHYKGPKYIYRIAESDK
jgi:hypothetical protein